MSDIDEDEVKSKCLCWNCIGETYLSDHISNQGTVRTCSYCGHEEETFLLDELADHIDTAFQQHYTRSSEENGEPVVDAIMNAAEIPQEAARDLQQILADRYYDHHARKAGEPTEYEDDSYYDDKGVSASAWQEEWRSFERSLKIEARFFSRHAVNHLTSLFKSISALRTNDDRPLLIQAGPETGFTSLYRARVFQSDTKLKEALERPDFHLGSPPPTLATAGRMNARGISVFYGSNEPNVALAEVRPPVGSRVAVARFDIIKPLHLLDLPAFTEVSVRGSIFDDGLASRLEHAAFLQSLSQRMTKPVMPDDEAFEYLATQAVADFLATEFEKPVDGIIFKSVQSLGGALNVVLFHKAARVEKFDLPNKTKIEASLGYFDEDGWVEDYSVMETVPSSSAEAEKPKGLIDFLWSTPDTSNLKMEDAWDSRDNSLKIDVNSLEVHTIEGVTYHSKPQGVHRHRY